MPKNQKSIERLPALRFTGSLKVPEELPNEFRRHWLRYSRTPRLLPDKVRAQLKKHRCLDELALTWLVNCIYGDSELLRRNYHFCPLPEPPITGYGVPMRWVTMHSKKVLGHRVYLTQPSPRVELANGGSWKVAWTIHALDRLVERCTVPEAPWTSIKMVHEFMKGGDIKYTVDKLPDGDECVDIWLPVDNWNWTRAFTSAICGLHVDGYHLLVGSCPLTIHGGCALLKTTLSAAMPIERGKHIDGRILEMPFLIDLQMRGDEDAFEEWKQHVRELHRNKPLLRRFRLSQFNQV